MARKRQDSTVLYDDIVLQHVEWVYLSKELTGISVRAFQVLCFLDKVVLVHSLPFHVYTLPFDHFCSNQRTREGLSELVKAGLITRVKNGLYLFNDAGNTFIQSFQHATAIRATKLKKPLKSKIVPE